MTKYYYQDIIGKVVELSKSVYYRTRKEWNPIVKEETGVSNGQTFRKLICISIDAL